MKTEKLIEVLQKYPGKEVVFWDGLESHNIGVIQLDTQEDEIVINSDKCLDFDDKIYVEE